jgi:hypothetical protein
MLGSHISGDYEPHKNYDCCTDVHCWDTTTIALGIKAQIIGRWTMSEITIADGVGMLGAALIVIAYFLLQAGRLDSRSLLFSIVNGFGAAAIIFSLIYEFNLSAMAMELFWLAISLYGIYGALARRRGMRE